MENHKTNNSDNIIASLATGIVALDAKGKITVFNRAAESITGLLSKKAKGRYFDEVLGNDFFDNPDLTYRSIKDTNENTEMCTRIWTSKNNNPQLRLFISPIRGNEGEKEGIVLAFQDVTRNKKSEEQANRSGRLTAMEEMAAKIAHEIRNPLGSIELFATALMKDLEGSRELHTLAEHISSGVKSINSIISNLLLFIRPEQKADFKVMDIHETLQDSLFFSTNLIQENEGIEVITEFSAEDLTVCGDPELLKQVYLNLILNAIQAMPSGGKISVTTKKYHDQQSDSYFAEITCSDTGEGISKEDVSRIFDPFFTTKKNGTGLGLPIVHSIIKLHGGSIDISSKKGEITVCTLTLPLWDDEIPTNEVAMGDKMLAAGPLSANPGSEIVNGAE